MRTEAKYCVKWRCETPLRKSKHRAIEIVWLRDYDRKSSKQKKNNKSNFDYQNSIPANFSLNILKEIPYNIFGKSASWQQTCGQV